MLLSFLIILLYTVHSSPLIPEDAFTEIKPFEETFLEIKGDLKEAYHFFDNQFDSGDIAVNLRLGKGYSVECYIYDSLDSIKTNEQGQYEEFMNSIILNEKHTYISTLSKNKYYLIFKDIKGFFYYDYIQIFNENNEVKLESNKVFEIFKFYSQMKYSFSFDINEGEIAKININSENDEGEGSTVIYWNGVLTEIQGFRINNYIINGNSPIDDTCEINLIYYTPYELKKINVLVEITERTFKELIPGKNININYINSQSYFFYANLKTYTLNEENSITFAFDFNLSQEFTSNIKYFYGAVVSSKDASDETFTQLLPDESNSTIIKEYELYSDTYYHVYFKNLQNKIGNEENYLILTFYMEYLNFTSQNFKAGLSEPIEYIELNDEDSFQSKSVEMVDNIPKYMQITIPLSFKHSYVFYSTENILTVINSTLLTNEKSINDKRITRQLFAINKDNENSLNVFTFVFFGSVKKEYLYIQQTLSDLIYYSSYRPSYTYNLQITNCSQPYYILGNYESVSDKNLFFNSISGECNLIYKNSFNEKDNSILPTSNDVETTNPLTLTTNYEILSVQCKYPGFADITILDNTIPEQLQFNKRYKVYIPKNNEKNILFPSIASEVTVIEIVSLTKTLINISLDSISYDLTKDKYYQRLKFEKDKIPQRMTIKAEEDSVFELKINNMEFENISEGYSENTSPYLAFKLKNSNDYREAKIEIQNSLVEGYFYRIEKALGNEEGISYLPFVTPIDSVYKKESTSLVISNPYDKYPQSNFYKGDYYVSVYLLYSDIINQGEKNYINFTYVNKTEPIKPNEIVFFNQTNTKLIIPTNSESSETKINIITHKCTSDVVDLSFLYYDTLLNKYSTGEKLYNAFSLDKYPFDIDLSINTNFSDYDRMDISYSYSSQPINIGEIDDFNSKNLTVEILMKYKIIKWTPIENFNKSNDEYKIYIFLNNKTEIPNINNYCYLTSLTNRTNDNANNTDVPIIHTTNDNIFSFDLKEFKRKNLTVNIIAKIKGNYSLNVIYTASFSEMLNESYLWFIITGPTVFLLIVFLIVVFYRWNVQTSNVKNDMESEKLNPNSIEPIG